MFCLVLLLSWTSWCLRRPRYYAKSLEIDSESVNAKPNDMLMNNEKNECNHRKKRQQKLPACIFGHLSAPTPENRKFEIYLFSLCNEFLDQSIRSTNVQVWQSFEGSHAVDTSSLCVTSSRQRQTKLHPTVQKYHREAWRQCLSLKEWLNNVKIIASNVSIIVSIISRNVLSSNSWPASL